MTTTTTSAPTFPRKYPGGRRLDPKDYEPLYYSVWAAASGRNHNKFVDSCGVQLYEKGFLTLPQMLALARVEERKVYDTPHIDWAQRNREDRRPLSRSALSHQRLHQSQRRQGHGYGEDDDDYWSGWGVPPGVPDGWGN